MSHWTICWSNFKMQYDSLMSFVQHFVIFITHISSQLLKFQQVKKATANSKEAVSIFPFNRKIPVCLQTGSIFMMTKWEHENSIRNLGSLLELKLWKTKLTFYLRQFLQVWKDIFPIPKVNIPFHESGNVNFKMCGYIRAVIWTTDKQKKIISLIL